MVMAVVAAVAMVVVVAMAMAVTKTNHRHYNRIVLDDMALYLLKMRMGVRTTTRCG